MWCKHYPYKNCILINMDRQAIKSVGNVKLESSNWDSLINRTKFSQVLKLFVWSIKHLNLKRFSSISTIADSISTKQIIQIQNIEKQARTSKILALDMDLVNELNERTIWSCIARKKVLKSILQVYRMLLQRCVATFTQLFTNKINAS